MDSLNTLEGLNDRQREAVQHVEGPLLVLAGAGSGKTRVITHRIAHLMAVHRVPGWAILAVTFTNKAAGEMRERVQSLVAEIPGGSPTVATFHSFCVRLLRREGAPLANIRPGFTTRFNIYDDDDQIAILKAVYKQLGLDDKFMPYRAALSRISHAKSHKQSPEELARSATDPITTRLAAVYERYEAQLRESNALDFDDLLLEAVRLLTHDDPTRERLNRRYEFVMVDEYQDTNRSQYELMRLLTQERGNICVVGDEDQSIYGWRGANIRNILDFERDFPGATIIRLEQNYRSTQEYPRSRQRRGRAQHRAHREIAVDRIFDAAKKSRFTKRPMRRTKRCTSPTRSKIACRKIRKTAWRCSIAPTRNRARSKKRCGATAANTSSSAASVSISAPK